MAPARYLLHLILEDEIEKNLSYLIMQNHKGLTIEVHPILYTYLTSGFISQPDEMELEVQTKSKSKVQYKLSPN